MQKKRVWKKNFLLLILLWSTLSNFIIAETITTKGKFGVMIGDEFNITTETVTNTIKEYYLEETDTGNYLTLDLNNTEQILWDKYLNKNVKIKLKATRESMEKSYQKDDVSSKKYKIINIDKIVDIMHGRAMRAKTSNQNKYKKPWLNLLCKFADVDTEPETPEQINAMFANSYPYLEDYWKKTTYGHVDISGTKTISKWVTMEHNKDYYYRNNRLRTPRIRYDCVKAASKLVDTSKYSNINIFYNGNDHSAFGGENFTFFPDFAHKNPSVIAHEMGHVYGFYHSFVKGLVGQPYMNKWDVMSQPGVGSKGIPTPQHTIAYNKESIGAIASKYILQYQRSTGNTKDVHITRLENVPTGNSYSIAHVYSADKNKHYFVEVRDNNTSDKYDNTLPGKGVFIYDVVTPEHIELIVDKHNIVKEAMFKVGDTFNDTKNDISIHVLEEEGKGYKIRIGAAKLNNTKVSNPYPNNVTVLQDVQGEELKVKAPEAVSAIFYYGHNSNFTISNTAYKAGKKVGNYFSTTIPYKYPYILKSDTKNYWYVVVKNSDGLTTRYPASGLLSFFVTSDSSKTMAPSNLKATNVQRTTAILQWNDNSNNETGFKIYRDNTLVKTLEANVTSYILQGLTPNATYIYRVKAYNTVDESSATSISFKTLLLQKAHLTSPTASSTLNGSTLTVTWNKNSAVKVKLYVYDMTNRKTLLNLDLTGTIKDNITVPTNGERIRIRLTSFYESGDWNYEKIYITAKKDIITKPTAPSNLQKSNVDKTTATLTWNDNSNSETGFKVYQGTSTTPVETLGANVKSLNLTGLTADTNYTYSVKAYNTAGNSAATTTSFKTLPDTTTFKKAHITSPTAGSTLTGSTMTVTWEKNSASKVWLYVYDSISKKFLFSGYLTGTSKTIPISTKGGRLQIGLYTYIPTSSGYKGLEQIYVTSKK